ncbi:hypothetical protein TEA_022829 [Camellia sinensis var. sinensis]|uniref:Ubiquitin carboxyl-terminal hydrolase n=1 Tax=Camellia sinensis var. sinensis TaxID=542762 RepID=A0A4S4EKK4_CAMSN|nr:hypothetical protein TEA_022829 [Camellia sinensis var. sinensis]
MRVDVGKGGWKGVARGHGGGNKLARVLVFGSFTEDEIKSFQRQPPEIDIEIKFGSLDAETLRSVGIFNSKLTEAEYSKRWPSKLVNKENAVKVCTTESISQVIATTVEKNGSINDTCLVSCSDCIEELKTDNVELSVSSASENVSDLLKQNSTEHYVTKGVTKSSTLLTNEALVDSSVGVDLINSEESIPKASNGLGATVRNLLPRGLVNLGNLCFLNATLQALLSCPPFVLLLQELRNRDIQKSSSKKKEMLLETGRPFRPVMFESILQKFTPEVPNSISGRHRQEDAQEFLSFVMHQMHDELLKLEGQVPSSNGGSASLVSSINDEDDSDEWETVGPKNRTAITRTQSFIPSKLSSIFGGQLRSVVKAKGRPASQPMHLCTIIKLYLASCIEDALHLFSAPETLEGYRTSAAKAEVVNASKTVKILELSEIMILHLMRFNYGGEGCTKLHKPVCFPLELVLGRELLFSPSSEGRRYELVATITHHGREPWKGHYTADTCHPNGKWLHFDDASVTVIPTSKVLHEQAYILFYKQL